MNKVHIIGRLTKDPDVRVVQREQEITAARFVLAVARRTKNKEGNYEADFISCVAFGSSATFIEKFIKKGNRIAVVGHIQTGSYQKEGVTIHTVDVIVDEVENLTPRPAGTHDPGDFIPADDDPTLPFN